MKTPALLFLLFLSVLIFSQDSTGYSLKITKISKNPTLESRAKVYEITEDSYLRIRTKSGQIIKSTNDYTLITDAIVLGKKDTLKLTDIESIAATYKKSKGLRIIGTILIVYAPVAFITGIVILISFSYSKLFGVSDFEELVTGLFFMGTSFSAILFGTPLLINHKTFYTDKWKIEIQEVKINN